MQRRCVWNDLLERPLHGAVQRAFVARGNDSRCFRRRPQPVRHGHSYSCVGCSTHDLADRSAGKTTRPDPIHRQRSAKRRRDLERIGQRLFRHQLRIDQLYRSLYGPGDGAEPECCDREGNFAFEWIDHRFDAGNHRCAKQHHGDRLAQQPVAQRGGEAAIYCDCDRFK
jgi:hypothetical protein